MSKKIGLICEGGGTKAAYTCGVLQCFLDNDINFPYTVKVSAGAEVLLPFVAKQRERLRFSGVEAASDPKAIGLSPLLHEKGVFGIDYVCKFIERHEPLDYKTFMKNPTKLDIGVIIWIMIRWNIIQVDFDPEEQNLMKSILLFVFVMYTVYFQGHKCMDAGLVDMIPIEQSIPMGWKNMFLFLQKKKIILESLHLNGS